MTAPTSGPRRPPGRYDEPRALPRPLAISLAGVLGAVLLVGAYLAYDRSTERVVPHTLLGYEVVDDFSVAVQFTVHRGEDQRVRCVVHALDRNKREIGSEDVDITPEDSDTIRIVVPTASRAASADVVGCRPA